ncbi:MAG: 2-amino-4-hydroxy-6-hydroxymethyldihydropteridine diphosphokinase [Anaerolineae bacterium]|nr:2-amino-4-hydroxy-6-hydroxymethyldihydropteridine diphosphokinase [Anaerolineae bacterium]
MARVYLALGTNLGDRMQNLQEAIRRIGAAVRVSEMSSVYETEPWGVASQPQFLNLVVAGETELEPTALLETLKRIEKDMGRRDEVRYGPRVIDLDILFYDDQLIRNPNLEIPHPRLAQRRFVLVPLAEIAPRLVHPRLNRTIQDLLAQLADTDDVRLFQRSESINLFLAKNS